MVNAMLPTPLEIGSEAQDAREAADQIIGERGFEKRVMTTVVEQDKNSNKKASGQNRQRQGQPDRHLLEKVHGAPQAGVGNESVCHLPSAAPNRGTLVLGNDLLPGCRIRPGPVIRSNEITHTFYLMCGLINRAGAWK